MNEREKDESLTIRKLDDGWLITKGKPSAHQHGKTRETVCAAETDLAAAKQALLWLSFDLPRVEEVLPVLADKGCR